jgi:hypothetical protein
MTTLAESVGDRLCLSKLTSFMAYGQLRQGPGINITVHQGIGGEVSGIECHGICAQIA